MQLPDGVDPDTVGKLRDRQIRFVLAKPLDLDRIWTAFLTDFVPDEPGMRSLVLYEGAGNIFSRMLQNYFAKQMQDFLANIIKKETSILALDKDDNIVGMMLGHPVLRTDTPETIPDWAFINRYFSWMMPQKLYHLAVYSKSGFTDLRLDPHMAMDDLDCDDIFIGVILAVSREVRGMRMGSLMLQMSLDLAKKANSAYYYSVLSGIYSQKIFKDRGFVEFKRLKYADLKDKYGNEVVHDRGEHEFAITAYKLLKEREVT